MDEILHGINQNVEEIVRIIQQNGDFTIAKDLLQTCVTNLDRCQRSISVERLEMFGLKFFKNKMCAVQQSISINNHCHEAKFNSRRSFTHFYLLPLHRVVNYCSKMPYVVSFRSCSSFSKDNKWKENTIDIDRELQRYNIEEFYNNKEEVEDFSSDWSSSSVEEDFYGIEMVESQIKPKAEQITAVPASRGVRGVFDVECLVEMLKEERLEQIGAISIDESLGFVEHMVIASGVSALQRRSACRRVQKEWKLRRSPRDKESVPIQGLKRSTEEAWLAIDLGNITMHVFDKETRAHYDLESLWTIGGDPELEPTSKFMHLADTNDPEELFRQLQDKYLGKQRSSIPFNSDTWVKTAEIDESDSLKFASRTTRNGKAQNTITSLKGKRTRQITNDSVIEECDGVSLVNNGWNRNSKDTVKFNQQPQNKDDKREIESMENKAGWHSPDNC